MGRGRALERRRTLDGQTYTPQEPNLVLEIAVRVTMNLNLNPRTERV